MWLRHKAFFQSRPDVVHVRKFLGSGDNDQTDSLISALAGMGACSERPAFLKIDIEGGEYELLDQFVHVSDMLTGLVIEFHDLDRRYPEVLSFVSRFRQKIVHTHVNNHVWPPTGRYPYLVELTFSPYQVETAQIASWPHVLDRPNKLGIPDVRLDFEDF
jgi:hypothetical protein